VKQRRKDLIPKRGYALRDLVEAKQQVNALEIQNVRLKTRTSTCAKEISRRTRVLKELWSVSKSDLPLTENLANRLNDKNALSLTKQRCKLLEATLSEREQEISRMKRHETFTKIVELEGALTALRSEAISG